MLALGIPGSGTAAMLLGGLMVWGLNPGPLLFVEHKDFVWGLIASMYLGNIVGLVIVLTTVPLFAAILRVPFAAIAPMIVVSCAIGAYADPERHVRHLADAAVRRGRLCLEEDSDYPAGAVRAGAGAWRPRRRRVSPDHDGLQAATWGCSGRTRWSAPSPRWRCCCCSGLSSTRCSAASGGCGGRRRLDRHTTLPCRQLRDLCRAEAELAQAPRRCARRAPAAAPPSCSACATA